MSPLLSKDEPTNRCAMEIQNNITFFFILKVKKL